MEKIINTPIYSSTRFQREAIVNKLLKEKRDITIEDIKIALCNDIEAAKITQEVINICKNMIRNPIVLPLPIPNTKNVEGFSEIAGSEDQKANKVPGCYRIF
jgi:hypothetical protein